MHFINIIYPIFIHSIEAPLRVLILTLHVSNVFVFLRVGFASVSVCVESASVCGLSTTSVVLMHLHSFQLAKPMHNLHPLLSYTPTQAYCEFSLVDNSCNEAPNRCLHTHYLEIKTEA